MIYKINFADRRDYLVITENIIAPGVIRINRVLPDENIPEYLQTVSVMDCRYL